MAKVVEMRHSQGEWGDEWHDHLIIVDDEGRHCEVIVSVKDHLVILVEGALEFEGTVDDAIEGGAYDDLLDAAGILPPPE